MSEHIIHVIRKLKETKGTNAKLDVLKSLDSKQITALMNIARYSLDTMLSFRVKSIDDFMPSIFSGAAPTNPYPLSYGIELLMKLNDHGSANNGDRSQLAEIRYYMLPEDAELLDLIVARDLRCGCGLSTLRKVWGKDFLPDFEYALMGAYSASKIHKLIKFEEGAFSQLKSDGARCIVTKRGNVYKGRSRNGKAIEGIDLIIQNARQLDGSDRDFDLDGELVVLDENGKILPRKTGNGIISKGVKGTLSQEEASRIRFIVWDMIHIIDGKHSKDTYGIRWGRLKVILERSGVTNIIPTESKTVWSLKEAKEHYREMVLRGEEGTILKTNGSIWTPGDSSSKREANGLKFKEELEGDFKIVAWYYGEKGKKYEHAIGGFTVESACGKVRTNVGTGITDKERFVDNHDIYLNRIVELTYNARIMARNSDTWKLFLPRITEWRDDKSVADDLDKIIANEEASRELGMG